jgi:uncharacterized protein YlxW (UPF0749 family)
MFALALLAFPVHAQDAARERAERLRAQLSDLQAQQIELQSRVAQIDEDIQPYNIERSLAGIGSTHPEELREARRRRLEIQRHGIQSQLETLASTRTRLEAAIAAADAEAYRQTVGQPSSLPANPQAKRVKQSHRTLQIKKRRSPSTD